MKILYLSRSELSLIIQGMIMYLHVPFSDIPKPDLQGANRVLFDTTDRKLVTIRETERRSPDSGQIQLKLSKDEMSLLCRVIKTDTAWCDRKNSKYTASNYRCHFGKDRQEVHEVLAKLLSHCE